MSDYIAINPTATPTKPTITLVEIVATITLFVLPYVMLLAAKGF
jgi:hypothetical protein